jgi:hypothetical protein
MTALPLHHLDDFTLAALALGDLPPSLGAEARRHLHGCASCAGRFQAASAEAERIGDPGEQALDASARPAPQPLVQAARPDGGAVLVFPSSARIGGEQGTGLGKLASRVFGRFEQLLHAAAGVPERDGSLEVASGEEVAALHGAPGETLEVWFGNPHPHGAWLTVVRQGAGARAAPVVCDGPRRLEPGRDAGAPTRLAVGDSEDVVLAVLTRDEPPPRQRLDESLALGLLLQMFEAHGTLGQVLCRVLPRS